MRRHPRILEHTRSAGHLLLLLMLVLQGASLGAQGDPRSAFLDAVGTFSLALEGTFGDEGATLKTAVASMADVLAQWDDTIRTYERAMAADLASADPQLAARLHLGLGSAYLDRGRTSDALKELAAARVSDPSRTDIAALERDAPGIRLIREVPGIEPFLPPAAYRDAFASLDRGELVEAIARLRDGVSRDPLAAPASEALRPAAAAFRDGRVADARTQLEAVVRRSPGLAEAHRVLGLVHAADGNYDDGVSELRAAVRLNPGDERTRLALADLLVASGQLAAAEQALREALTAVPESGRAHYQLGLIYQRQGRAADAIGELNAARDRQPMLGANTIDRMIGALSQGQQDLDAAADAFAARVARVPGDATARVELGAVYLLQGDHDKARTEFDAAIRLAPARADAHIALGQLQLREGRAAEAAGAARRAVELDASSKEARYLYATALVRAGDVDEGARQMQEYQRLQAQDDTAQSRAFELGRLRRGAEVSRASGDHAGAIALLRQALTIEPTAPASHLDLGLALLAARQLPEAIERLTTAAALNAPYEVHRHLAEAYGAVGQRENSEKERGVYERLKRDAIRHKGGSR